MKNVIKTIISVRYWIIVLLLLLIFQADTVYAKENSGQCGDDVYWTLSDKGVMTISGTGKMWDFRNDADYFDYHECPWADFKSDIKKVVFKSGVTYVGADAFHECGNITKITFTDSITVIAPFAFRYCVNLESVELPKKLETLGQESFMFCEKITKVTIPDTVSFLDGAFQYCTALEDVYIGGMSVPTYIHYRGAMFRGCTALENIKVSEDNIALKAVDGLLCEKDSDVLLQYPLGRKDKKFVVPETVIGIADFALNGAEDLEEIVLPEGLEWIGAGAFDDCKNLKTLTIPSTVEQVNGDIMTGTYRLEWVENKSNVSIIMPNGSGGIWTDEDGNLIKELKNGKAYQHGLASGVVVDDQTLNVGDSVVIPSEIQYLYVDYPQNVKDLIFESSNPKVVSVDENGKLVAKKAGTAVITIRNRYTFGEKEWSNAFEATCTITVKKSTKVSIKEAEVTLSKKSYTYNGKTKKPSVTVVLDGKTLKKNTDYTVSYEDNKNIGTATVIIKGKGKYTGKIEETFTIKAKKGTEFKVDGLKYEITNASSKTVSFIGLSDSKLKKITIPKTVKYGGATFKVTAVAGNALKNNKKITKVTMGANIKSIGKNAFYGCKKLKTIEIKSTKLEKVGSKAFKGISSKATIKVPKSKLSAYRKLLKGKGKGTNVKITKYN